MTKQTETVKVTVEPYVNDEGRLECNITGDGGTVIDDAICLRRDREYQIDFKLHDNSKYYWDVEDPFCAKVGKCPPRGAPQHGVVKLVGTPTRSQFTVEAKQTTSKQIFHYRLNFEGGRTYDPIIIRD